MIQLFPLKSSVLLLESSCAASFGDVIGKNLSFKMMVVPLHNGTPDYYDHYLS
jgi:hypothetical protein